METCEECGLPIGGCVCHLPEPPLVKTTSDNAKKRVKCTF